MKFQRVLYTASFLSTVFLYTTASYASEYVSTSVSSIDISKELSKVDSLVKSMTVYVEPAPLDTQMVATPMMPRFEVDLVNGNQYPFSKGAIPYDFTADCKGAVLPTMGHICSNYGSRRGRMHSGVDLKLNLGDPVVTAFSGVVRFARNYMGYGKMVVVAHPNGLETVYSHLSKIQVSVGQSVEAGQLVGLGGRTGRATTTHLHFEVRLKGRPINPSSIFDFSNKSLRTELYVHKNSTNQRTSSSALMAKNNIVPSTGGVHTVRSGDTLAKIAKAYGVTIEQLCELNQLTRNTILQLGQKIICRQY